MALPADINPTNIEVLDHPNSQIRRNNGLIIIPTKYTELFLDQFGPDEDSSSDEEESTNQPNNRLIPIPATQSNWELVQAIYVTSFWLHQWYSEEDHLPTPKTQFMSVAEAQKLSDTHFPSMPFVRLSSLSTKNPQPYGNLKQAIQDIQTQPRCQKSMRIADLAGQPNLLALRAFVDLNPGKEYRCVIFGDKLRKVVPNDDKISDLTELQLETRCQDLLKQVRHCLPCTDCVMDVWISDDPAKSKDLLIEFNSFGIIGNSYSDHIDWTDTQLYLEIFPPEIIVNVHST